jgi:uncharacterized membrane protein
MTWPLRLFAHLSLLSTGAIFGFFYAWICSTMWGLDAADPSVAIAAMQAMNASVGNVVFAPVFFGTPVVLLVAAVLARQAGFPVSARAFLAAGLVYFSPMSTCRWFPARRRRSGPPIRNPGRYGTRSEPASAAWL